MDIKQIVKTQGWEEIKEILRQTMESKRVDTSKTTEQIGQEYLAIEKAREMVYQAINQVEKAGEEWETKDNNYE